MLVSAVIDPSTFNEDYFDESYRHHAEDFLNGIIDNGLLIFDSRGELRKAFIEQIMSLSTPVGQQLQVSLADLLKMEPERFVACYAPSNEASLNDLLSMARRLKKNTETDALIVSSASLETLISEQENVEGVIPLSKYRDSDFEKCRRRYYGGLGSIDMLSKQVVKDMIIRAIRFSKSLKFYDRHIGLRSNTCYFGAGIEYILSLWYEHGFFASDQDFGEVQIYACSADCIVEEDTDYKKKKKKKQNTEQHEKIVQEIIMPIKKNFPCPIEVVIKEDPENIFHARYLESEHAVVRVDRGFRLFEQGRKFRQNLFTLNMSESFLLGRYRSLPDADFDGTS